MTEAIFGSVFTLVFLGGLAAIGLFCIFIKLAGKKPKAETVSRGCGSCLYLSATQGLLFCGHTRNHYALTRLDDLCPLYVPYKQPSEQDVLAKHMQRCYNEVKQGE